MKIIRSSLLSPLDFLRNITFVLMLLVFVSCGSSTGPDGNTLVVDDSDDTDNSDNTDDSDDTNISGSLNFSNLTVSSLTVAWDGPEASGQYEYRLYRSTNSNISDVEGLQSNGIAVTGWLEDTFSASVSSLTPGETYYFNILLQNQAGDLFAYTQSSQTTLSCSGVAVGGYCWYLADGAESCVDICSNRDGTHEATVNYAGVVTDGDDSNADSCGKVIEALANDLTSTDVRIITSGYSATPKIGCIHDDQSMMATTDRRPAIHTIEATTQEASSQSHLRRACACNS